MKRPVIWFSAAFAAGVALALRSFSLPWVLALTLLAGCFLCGWKWSAFRPACVLFAGVLSGLCYTQAYHAVIQAPCAALDGTSKSMIVEVTDFPKQYDTGQRVEIRVIGSRIGCPLNFRTLAYLPKTEQDIKPGDELTATFDFYIPNQTQGFDRASYYRSQGYAILAHVNEEFGMVVTLAAALLSQGICANIARCLHAARNRAAGCLLARPDNRRSHCPDHDRYRSPAACGFIACHCTVWSACRIFDFDAAVAAWKKNRHVSWHSCAACILSHGRLVTVSRSCLCDVWADFIGVCPAKRI